MVDIGTSVEGRVASEVGADSLFRFGSIGSVLTLMGVPFEFEVEEVEALALGFVLGGGIVDEDGALLVAVDEVEAPGCCAPEAAVVALVFAPAGLPIVADAGTGGGPIAPL